ncbi:neuropeptide F receptor [Eurytemora carolleeae]|uniref:neuropeptide F receptor n=1 Tax=Eurytemora carolleeae TaxID=1294199 RepID=UPI000C75EB8F|nr:neuropeptide F receptor [Eurytemora carolleeae]|eukprot:XP_023345978.1 neuropeptide F receptor-like [Eurytemora affinis]
MFRNIFIFHLSFSDLILSLTIPFTALDALTSGWPLGSSLFVCKMVKSTSCIAVFMSSLSILSIALDRYWVICRSTAKQIGTTGAWCILPIICTTATILTSPLLYSSTLTNLKEIFAIQETRYQLPDDYKEEFSKILICYEDWSLGSDEATTKQDRIWFTIYSSGVQFILPLVIISVVYINIYLYLKDHRLASRSNNDRQKRTNHILVAISIIFFVSWTPFSVFCIISELFDIFEDSDTMILVYCICHLLGMSSACTNPILYGFLNEKFVKELAMLFPCLKPCLEGPPANPAQTSTKNNLKKSLQRLTATKVGNGKAESISLQSMEKNQPSNGVKKTNVLTVQAVNDGVSCAEETGFTQINHMTNNPLIQIETRDLAVVLNAQTEKINVCIQQNELTTMNDSNCNAESQFGWNRNTRVYQI